MPDLFLRALRSEEVERPPVWLMRQAGRYMPQYRALREKHTLWKLFHDPALAAEVTMQPIDVLGVDAAIVFSDILVIAEALGLSIAFPEGQGPRVEPAIHTPFQVDALELRPVREALWYVFETIERVKQRLKVPLIGFSGAPFTVASYLVDSTSKNAFERSKKWMQEDPTSFHLLLGKLTAVTIAYLKEQVRAGADVIQVFDSWANVLDDVQFQAFSLPYLQQIVTAVQELGVPVIVFCRDSSLRAHSLSQIKPSAISFDWHLPMKELRAQVPEGIAIQGNFPPEFLKLPQEQIQKGVKDLLTSMQGEKGWIWVTA